MACTTFVAQAQQAAAPFDRKLTMQGIEFRIAARNDATPNRVQIVPRGLKADNQPIDRVIDGVVTGAEVADLNADGSPEVYVYVMSASWPGRGTVVAYAANRRRSLSEVFFAPMAEHPSAASRGYRGRDTFGLSNARLFRKFPVYREADPDTEPSGGTRELRYRLTQGEASWLLKLDRTARR